MTRNADRMKAELTALGYPADQFTSPASQGSGEGVSFKYRIEDGSRRGDDVTLAVAVAEREGAWPEVAPHWLYISPPDPVLGEIIQGSQQPGVVDRHEDGNGRTWMVISAPPDDFWDLIDDPAGKSMKTYIERHIRRIWRMR